MGGFYYYPEKSYQVNKEGESKEYKLTSDANGNIIVPDELKRRLGLKDRAELKVVVHKDRIELFPNIHSLSKVYIEPTTLCNLTCQTCVRNTWKEPIGEMSLDTFDNLVEQLKDFQDLEAVMFGGFGEPTYHKKILYMIGRIKSLGINVEMTTNGTLLDEDMVKGLFANKLDTLWVSIDGVDEGIFENIRKGASYKSVTENLQLIKSINEKSRHKIKVGIAFVVMKENVNSLGNLHKLAHKVGATMISVSNVLPYSRDMVDQMLCNFVTSSYDSRNLPPLAISLPLIDLNQYTKESLFSLLSYNYNVSIITNQIGTETSKCKFMKERCTFIRWDGMVSPCMALLHSNSTYSYISTPYFKRNVTAYTLGSVNESKLIDIWNSEEYKSFRNKVDDYEFSPCHACASCELNKENKEDCFGNTFPTCGGCLWGQGVIQCP
ncbi:radical SAM protein [Tepidimicrobium xylanilyticum]|uniref:radical SAM protein n=1 Tax=Tepidimicrobium xylanilyticum TaxID=1123352 RepID=UPI00264D5724|nr:radical SAM protein [Tepidimicrobium xylanilyticum]GMG97516.1 tungsten cofactor oxidoreductase radical SAM maturase [Tepidimicrobium xylanilyticum]